MMVSSGTLLLCVLLQCKQKMNNFEMKKQSVYMWFFLSHTYIESAITISDKCMETVKRKLRSYNTFFRWCVLTTYGC